jgi:putative chitinase
MIDVATLVRCGVAATQARIYADSLDAACARFKINTKPRIAAFLAQTYHESQKFTRTEESLYYTTPQHIRDMWPTRVTTLAEAAKLCRNPQVLANRVYANRLGNGPESSGDGWAFRGHGLIQMTGRDWAKKATAGLGIDFVANFGLAGEPGGACLTAAWIWSEINANDLADASLIDAITRRVNGPGMVGADDRRSRFDDNLRALA